MAFFMLSADLVIEAGGSSSWERRSLALSSLILSFANNQRVVSIGLASSGVAYYLGERNLVTETSLTMIIEKLIKNPEQLVRMSIVVSKLEDEGGVERVVRQMEQCLA